MAEDQLLGQLDAEQDRRLGNERRHWLDEYNPHIADLATMHMEHIMLIALFRGSELDIADRFSRVFSQGMLDLLCMRHGHPLIYKTIECRVPSGEHQCMFEERLPHFDDHVSEMCRVPYYVGARESRPFMEGLDYIMTDARLRMRHIVALMCCPNASRLVHSWVNILNNPFCSAPETRGPVVARARAFRDELMEEVAAIGAALLPELALIVMAYAREPAIPQPFPNKWLVD